MGMYKAISTALAIVITNAYDSCLKADLTWTALTSLISDHNQSCKPGKIVKSLFLFKQLNQINLRQLDFYLRNTRHKLDSCTC